MAAAPPPTRVLLLEGDVPFAEELARALERATCVTTIAHEGQEGLAKALSTQFDLLVVAAELPQIYLYYPVGFHALRRNVSETSPDIWLGPFTLHNALYFRHVRKN